MPLVRVYDSAGKVVETHEHKGDLPPLHDQNRHRIVRPAFRADPRITTALSHPIPLSRGPGTGGLRFRATFCIPATAHGRRTTTSGRAGRQLRRWLLPFPTPFPR